MSLPNLTSETMVMLSAAWLDPKKQRKQLTALPLIAPLLPVLQEAHEGLLSKQRTGSAITAEIAAIQEEEARRDKRHDRKIRGTHSVLTGFAELTDDADLARSLLDLRDRLLPTGLQALTRSYVDEAGDGQRLPARIDPASKKLLGKLPAADGALQKHVDAWIEEATELGALEERRDRLSQQLGSGQDGPTAAEVVQARNAWIRAARALEANLALEVKADDATIEQILGPMRRAEAKADRRRAGAPNNGTTEETMDASPEPPITQPDASTAGRSAPNKPGAPGETAPNASPVPGRNPA